MITSHCCFFFFLRGNYSDKLNDGIKSYGLIVSASVEKIGCAIFSKVHLDRKMSIFCCVYGPYEYFENAPFYEVHDPSKKPAKAPCETKSATTTTSKPCPTPEPFPMTTTPKPSHAPATSGTTLAWQKFSHINSHIFSKDFPEPGSCPTPTPATTTTPKSCPAITTPKPSHATCETTLARQKFSQLNSHIFSWCAHNLSAIMRKYEKKCQKIFARLHNYTQTWIIKIQKIMIASQSEDMV